MSDAQQGHFPDASALKDPLQRLLAGALAFAFDCGVRTRHAFATRFARTIVTRLKARSTDIYVRFAAEATNMPITGQTKVETAIKFIEIAISKNESAASKLLDLFTIDDVVRHLSNEELWLFLVTGQTDPMKAGSLADALDAPFAFDPENAKFADFVRATIRHAQEFGLIEIQTVTAHVHVDIVQALRQLSYFSVLRLAIASAENGDRIVAKNVIDTVLSEPPDAPADERAWSASDAWTFVLAPIVAEHFFGTPKDAPTALTATAPEQPDVSATHGPSCRQEATAIPATSSSTNNLRTAPDQTTQEPILSPPAVRLARAPTLGSALRELEELPATPAKTRADPPPARPFATSAASASSGSVQRTPAAPPKPAATEADDDGPVVTYAVTGRGLSPEDDEEAAPSLPKPLVNAGSVAYARRADEGDDDEGDGVTVARESPSRPGGSPPPGMFRFPTPPESAFPAPPPSPALSAAEQMKENILRTLRNELGMAMEDSSSEDSIKSILMQALLEFDASAWHRVTQGQNSDARDFGDAFCESVTRDRGEMIASTLRLMLAKAGGATPPAAIMRGRPPLPKTPSPVGQRLQASTAAQTQTSGSMPQADRRVPPPNRPRTETRTKSGSIPPPPHRPR